MVKPDAMFYQFIKRAVSFVLSKKFSVKNIILCFVATLLVQANAMAQNNINNRKLNTIIVDPGHGGADNGAHGEYEGSLNSKEKDIVLGISMKLVTELKKRLPDVKIVPTRTKDTTMSVREKAQFANDHKGDLFICIHADAVALKRKSRITGYKNQVYYTTKTVKGKKVRTKHTKKVPIREYYKEPTSRKGTSTLILVARQSADKVRAMENSEMDFITDNDQDSSLNINYDSPEWKASALLYTQRYFRRSYMLANFVQEEVSKETSRPDLGVWQREKGLWVLHATQMPAILIETGFVANYEDERFLNSEKGQQEIAESIARAVVRYRDQIDGPQTAKVTKTTIENSEK